MVQPTWKTVWQFLTKLNILLPYCPAMVLLGIYTQVNLKCMYTQKPAHGYIYIYIAALFTTARSWKLPRCCAVGEWITKL